MSSFENAKLSEEEAQELAIIVRQLNEIADKCEQMGIGFFSIIDRPDEGGYNLTAINEGPSKREHGRAGTALLIHWLSGAGIDVLQLANDITKAVEVLDKIERQQQHVN